MKIILIIAIAVLFAFAACQPAEVVEPEQIEPVVQDIVEQPVEQGPGIFDSSDEVQIQNDTEILVDEDEELDILELTKPKGIDNIRVNSIQAKGSLFGGKYILNNLEIGMDGIVDIDLEKLTFTVDQYQFNVEKVYNATINCNARDAIINKAYYAVRQDEDMSIVCIGTPTQIQQTGILTLTIDYAGRQVFDEEIVMPPAIIKQDYIVYGPDKEY